MCLSLSLHTCVSLPSHMCVSLPLFTHAYHSLSLFTHAYHSLSLSSHMCVSFFTHVSLSSHMCLSLFTTLFFFSLLLFSFSLLFLPSLLSDHDNDHLLSRHSLSVCTTHLPSMPECTSLGPFVGGRSARFMQKEFEQVLCVVLCGVWCGTLNTSVCRFKTPPCLRAERPCHMRHGRLPVNTETF